MSASFSPGAPNLPLAFGVGRARRSVARRLDSFRIVKEAAIGARRSDAPCQIGREAACQSGRALELAGRGHPFREQITFGLV